MIRRALLSGLVSLLTRSCVATLGLAIRLPPLRCLLLTTRFALSTHASLGALLISPLLPLTIRSGSFSLLGAALLATSSRRVGGGGWTLTLLQIFGSLALSAVSRARARTTGAIPGTLLALFMRVGGGICSNQSEESAAV